MRIILSIVTHVTWFYNNIFIIFKTGLLTRMFSDQRWSNVLQIVFIIFKNLLNLTRNSNLCTPLALQWFGGHRVETACEGNKPDDFRSDRIKKGTERALAVYTSYRQMGSVEAMTTLEVVLFSRRYESSLQRIIRATLEIWGCDRFGVYYVQ